MADYSQKLLKKYKFAKKFRIMETVKLVSEITSKTKQENPNRTMEKNLILVPHFFFQKSGFISRQMSWSAITMYIQY